MRKCCLLALAPSVLFALCAAAQNAMPGNASVRPTGWNQVQGLGPHSRVSIKSDKETVICFVHRVDEQELTCSRSEAIGSEVLTFPREQIKSIKLSRVLLPGITGGVVAYADDIVSGPLIYRRLSPSQPAFPKSNSLQK
jgi:hypothetical protein